MGGRSHGSGLVRKLVWCGRRSFSFSSETKSVREGHVRVVVGNVESSEEALFEMEANYLEHPLLEIRLLQLTGEEYGYSYKGAIRIACDIHLFSYLLQLLNTGRKSCCSLYMDLTDLITKFSKAPPS